MAERIDSLPDDEFVDALVNIQQCVQEHLRVLTDEQLCQVAYVVADDLYKTAKASLPLYISLAHPPSGR